MAGVHGPDDGVIGESEEDVMREKPVPMRTIYKKRANIRQMPSNTPAERVYRRLLSVQIDFQISLDGPAEEILLDEVIDPWCKNHPELRSKTKAVKK